MRSIISNEPRCYICHTTLNLERHHIFEGPLRDKSEKYGCWVYLCHYHHQGQGLRHNPVPKIDLMLKQKAQEQFELTHSRDEFMEIFHRNWRKK